MRRLLAGLALATTLVAGCAPVTPEVAARARDLERGVDGAAVQLQLPESPRTISPFAPIGSAEQRLAQIQFGPLLAGSDGQLVPRFAGSWVPFNEGSRLALVAPRARWSDGRWFSALDMIVSLEAHLDPRSESPYANELLAIKGAREFREGKTETVVGLTSDAFRHAVITLERPNPHFVEHLTQIPIMPQHVYPDHTAMATADYRQATVGSGPYVVDRWESDGSVSFRPNPELTARGVKTRLQGVIARPVKPDDVAREMAAGRLDIADSHTLDPAALPGNVRLERAPGNTLVTLTPAPGKLPDVRVRRAILMAIDRQALVAEDLGGRGRVANSLLFQSAWTQEPGAPAEAPFDPTASRRLLSEAGWDPNRVVRIAVVAESGRVRLWDRVATQLKAAGINAEIARFDPSEQAALAERRDYDLLAGQWTAATRQPSLVTALVRCDGSKETNTGQYCNPALDDQLARATASTTAAEQAERWRTVSATLRDDLPVLPLFVPDAVIAESATMGPVDPALVPVTGLIDFWVRVK
ncbi:ABC transporter substrate-binding protein [Mariniluteicoccus flavus]